MEVGLLRVTVQERRAGRGGGHFQFEKLSWPVSLIGMAVNGSRQMVWPAYSGNLVNGQNHSPSTPPPSQPTNLCHQHLANHTALVSIHMHITRPVR
jgi:hypothetical protein